MAIYISITGAEFRWNPSAEYGDVASHVVGFNGQWTTAGRTDNWRETVYSSCSKNARVIGENKVARFL